MSGNAVTGTAGLRFEVLGPVRAWSGPAELDLRSPQQRAVLAILLLAQGRQVPRDIMIDALWGEDPPRTAPGTIRTYISRLRQCLEPSAGPRPTRLLTSVGNGYAFDTSGVTVDAEVFTRQVRLAQRTRDGGDPSQAAAHLSHALDLWRGVPLAGIQGPYADVQRARLLELRLAATEQRLSLDIELGRHLAAAAELRTMLAENPLRERLCELLMLALYQAGRQADALDVFGHAQRLLRDELGLDPGPGLQDLHAKILRADSSLAGTRTARPVRGSPPAQLPPPHGDLMGRSAMLSDVVAALTGDGGGQDGPGGPAVAVAVTGMPGIGKSALAIEAAQAVRTAFPGGQLYADLAGAEGAPADPGQVLAGFHWALGGAPTPGTPCDLVSAVRAELAGRRVLVVLDDVTGPGQARSLLAALHGCAVIMTAGQRMIGLPGVRWVELGPLPPGDAMRLLARHIGPARVAAERAAAGRVVELCGGLPIAIRTAAARLAARPAWAIADMAGQLAEELSLPVISHPDCMLVEAPFERAYRQLPPLPAYVFRQAALSGSPEISAATAAALTGLPEGRALAALESAADHHLVQAGPMGSYRYHPLAKLFAWRKALEVDGPCSGQVTREPGGVLARR